MRIVALILQKKYDVENIHSAFPFAPYGNNLDKRLTEAGISLTQLGSGYAVAPGRVLKDDGTPYKVYTPFYRAWSAHGWRKPVAAPKNPNWVMPTKTDKNLPNWHKSEGLQLQSAGEVAALNRFKEFMKRAADDYGDARNIPGIEGTSRMSPHLRWGEIHPRTILAALGQKKGHEVYRKEIAWREFYADVLHNNPHTSREYYDAKFKKMRYEKPGKKFTAWCEGKTGYPFVDAAMRQLFNPIEQGRRFDPEGKYIKRYIPELAHLTGDDIHEPWSVIGGLDNGYPEPIVDHAKERLDSLARLEEIKAAKPMKPGA